MPKRLHVEWSVKRSPMKSFFPPTRITNRYVSKWNERANEFRRRREGIIHDDDIIQKNTMFICSSTIFACLSRAANLFCNVFFCLLKRQHKVNPPRALTILIPSSRGNKKKPSDKNKEILLWCLCVLDFSFFLLFFYSFRKDRKISFGGEEKGKENNKKRNENWTWQIVLGGIFWGACRLSHSTSATRARSNHTPHSPLCRPFSALRKKNRYRVGRRENWIFRLSKPHNTPTRGRRAFRCLFLLLNVNGEHSYCVLPPQTPWQRRIEPPTFPDVCWSEWTR